MTIVDQPVGTTAGMAPAPDTRGEGSAAPGLTPAAPTLAPQDALAAHETILTEIYQSALPSVVHVSVLTSVPFRGASMSVPSVGSGFVWSSEGHVVTNHHVVDGAESVTVIFSDRLELSATVLGSDPDSDLAVLKVDPPDRGLQPLGRGDSGGLLVGHLVFAVGSPFGQQFSMTSGIVSAVGRVLRTGNSDFSNPEIIQTDAPINPGNSGGPLLDRHSNVIGINAQIISQSGANTGVGFAVPINTAKRIIPVLIDKGKYEYSYIGISGATLGASLAEANGLPRDARGVLVVGVASDGPAERAGLVEAAGSATVDGVDYPAEGDVITAINGVAIDGMDSLVAYLAEHTRPGDRVTVDVIGQGGSRQVSIELATRPEAVSFTPSIGGYQTGQGIE